MMRAGWISAWVIAAIAVLLHAPDAWALADDISIGGFSCSGGTANGQLIISGASCPRTLEVDHLFSFLICNFEQLSSNLMGHMFCGMISDLTPAVWAAVSLAIAVFGVSFTIGLVPATGQEAMMFIIKLAFITAFATNADVLIGTGYTFLVTAMREGSTLMLSTMNSSGINSGTDLYAEVDKMFTTFVNFATDSLSAEKPADYCKNAVFAVIALLLVILPVAAYVSIFLIGKIVMTLFRSVFAYIYALIGITFLLTMSPFFLSFYLFKVSRPLFDKWLGYLASFTLQVVLLFAFMTFVVLLVNNIKKDNVLSELTTIITHNEQTPTTTAFEAALSYCTLCDFHVVDKETGQPIEPTKKDADGKEINNPDFNSKGKLQCKQPLKAISPTFASSPDAFTDGDSADCEPGKLCKNSQVYALLTLMGYGLIPLVILVMIIDNLLSILPAVAQKLAGGLGATYAPQLGGGTNATGIPSTRLPGESYIDAASAGFKEGFADPKNTNSLSKATEGFKQAFSGMITGRRMDKTLGDGARLDGHSDTNPKAPPESLGIQNSFARWLRDPTSFGQ
jgi:hypothetical protein